MKRLTGLVSLVLLAAGLNFPLYAQQSVTDDAEVEPAKMTQIDRLARATNLHEMIADNFREGLEEEMGDADASEGGMPEEFSAMFIEKFSERFDSHVFLQQVIAPVLAGHFTVEELTMVADLVESDLGKQLIAAKMSGEEVDMDAMVESGEVSEEDGMKLMQIYLKLGKKKSLFDDGTLSNEIEQRAAAYGQNLAMEIIAEMMESYMEEGGMEETE